MSMMGADFTPRHTFVRQHARIADPELAEALALTADQGEKVLSYWQEVETTLEREYREGEAREEARDGAIREVAKLLKPTRDTLERVQSRTEGLEEEILSPLPIPPELSDDERRDWIKKEDEVRQHLRSMPEAERDLWIRERISEADEIVLRVVQTAPDALPLFGKPQEFRAFVEEIGEVFASVKFPEQYSSLEEHRLLRTYVTAEMNRIAREVNGPPNPSPEELVRAGAG